MDVKIFATKSDLMSKLIYIEAQRNLHYAISGMSETKEINIFTSLLDVEGLGYNTTGQYISGTQYLVVERKFKIKSGRIKQKKGGYLFDVGPLENPHSIIFQPNGIYNESCIIRGAIGTVSESKMSVGLYRFFRKEIIKDFKNIKGWYIGPEALILAQSGYRLITMHINQPPEYDLLID